MQRDDRHEPASSTARHAAVVGDTTRFVDQLNETLSECVRLVHERAATYANNTKASGTGFVFEADHVATYNARAALDGSARRAQLQPNGHRGDFRVVEGGRTVLTGEMKCHSTADHTETGLRGYGDQQRVAPADQLPDIKRVALRKGARAECSPSSSRQRVAAEHKEVREHVTDRIDDGQRTSTPRTRVQARRRHTMAKRGAVKPGDVLPSTKEALGRAAASGAKGGGAMGAAVGGGIAALQQTVAVLRGRAKVGDAALEVGKRTVVGAGDGALKGAVGRGAQVLAVKAAARVGKPVLKRVLGSSAPAVVAVAGVELIKDGVAYGRGKIDAKQFRRRALRTGVSTGTAVAGAKLGAVVGTLICPGLGTLIGGFVGSLAGGLAGGALVPEGSPA